MKKGHSIYASLLVKFNLEIQEMGGKKLFLSLANYLLKNRNEVYFMQYIRYSLLFSKIDKLPNE